MAASQEDPFLYMCHLFTPYLPPDDASYWEFALAQYERGLWSQELIRMTMEAFQANISQPSTPSTAASSRPQATCPPGNWPPLPKANKIGPRPQGPQNQKGDGKPSSGQKGNGMAFLPTKGNGKGFAPQGDGMAFLPTKGKGKGNEKGKNAFRFAPREITATDRADAMRRLRRFHAEHDSFVFRPREDVPREYELVYAALGENGPQFYKNLRHHLKDQEGGVVAGRVLQYIAERSHWRVDRLNHVEKNRKFKRERDAQSSRMSVASGFTNMSTRTQA